MSLAKSRVAENNRTAEVRPHEIAFEPLELSGPLIQFVGNANRDSSLLPETEPAASTLFDICDDLISTNRADAIAETRETKADLVDPSKWFDYNDAESLDGSVEDQHLNLHEESSSDFICESTTGNTFDDTVAMDIYSSTAGNANEMGNETIDSATAQATDSTEDERRKHPREDSSDLVWIEYFNSSMECMVKKQGEQRMSALAGCA